MSSTPPELTPQQRLALSRRAIVRHMHRNDVPNEHQRPSTPAHELPGDYADDAWEDQPASGNSTWQLVKHTLGAWWRHHPAHIALEVGKPMLHRYAEDKPMKLLGIAVAVGAAAVVLRPWKLVPVTGLLLATLKSSQVTGLALSLLSRNSTPKTPKDAS